MRRTLNRSHDRSLDYGPWVRLAWCRRCARRTEQSRWHVRTAPADQALRVRCHECSEEQSLAG